MAEKKKSRYSYVIIWSLTRKLYSTFALNWFGTQLNARDLSLSSLFQQQSILYFYSYIYRYLRWQCVIVLECKGEKYILLAQFESAVISSVLIGMRMYQVIGSR